MASISTLANGTLIVQFVDGDNRRRTLRLGKVARSTAATIRNHVASIVRARQAGWPLDPDTVGWLATLRGPLREKLVELGLVEAPQASDLAGFTRAYIDSRRDLKPRTKINLEQARKYLIEHFRADKPMGAISEGDADAFRRWLREHVGENTTRGHCKKIKQFFRAAVRKRLIPTNPFADMKALSVGANRERDYNVTRDEIAKVLEACGDNTQYKLLFALSRFGGLRCPSEHLALRWGDVDFELGRMTVRSPKTEHHQGKESRLVPLFPELRPLLEQAFYEAGRPATSEPVITLVSIRRDRYANVRTQMANLVRRAGLTPWPKLCHNMRASRETELAATFPEHVTCEWIGNSPKIARKHYLRVTDADFERAIASGQSHSAASGAADALQNALQPRPAPTCQPAENAARDRMGQLVATLSVHWSQLTSYRFSERHYLTNANCTRGYRTR